jgi:hypothetical protein
MNRLQPSFVKPTTKLTSGGEVNPLAKLTTRMKIQWERESRPVPSRPVPENTSHKERFPTPGEPTGEGPEGSFACLLVKPTNKKVTSNKEYSTTGRLVGPLARPLLGL